VAKTSKPNDPRIVTSSMLTVHEMLLRSKVLGSFIFTDIGINLTGGISPIIPQR
jgi:hypothetical protein